MLNLFGELSGQGDAYNYVTQKLQQIDAEVELMTTMAMCEEGLSPIYCLLENIRIDDGGAVTSTSFEG
jgi:hypothetical protein